jgi:protein NrfD
MPGELQIPNWTGWIVLYFFAGGIAGGAYFIASMVELVGDPADRPIARFGYYLAFPLALLCALFLTIDLGQPLSFWHMVVYSRTFLPWPKWDSPISVGAFALLFFGLFSFISFVDALVETRRLPWAPFQQRYSSLPRKIYALFGAFFGFFLASYTGVLLATTQLPLWSSTPLLGPLFLASGASTGVAAITLGLALTRRSVDPIVWVKLRQADTIALVLEAVLLVAFVGLLLVNGPIPSIRSLVLLIGGTLILGLLWPLTMQLRSNRPGVQTAAGLTTWMPLLVLVGGLIMRLAVVMGGQGLL